MEAKSGFWRKTGKKKAEEISTEGMTPFFTAVAELARRKGFKIKGVQGTFHFKWKDREKKY